MVGVYKLKCDFKGGKNMKKIIAIVMVMALVMTSLVGCGSKAGNTSSDPTKKPVTTTNTPATIGPKETVKLTVWGGEDQQDLIKSMVEAFKTAYADKANFDIQVGVQSESTAKDTVLADVEAAADVFAFADDQINDLVAAGALLEVNYNKDNVVADNSPASIEAATVDGKLFAYPMTASNGYFMFYDKSVFSADDVKNLDKMLEVAGAAGKKITMQLDNAWYLYSFFAGAGLSLGLNDDKATNNCTWNGTDGTYKGVDVANAILNIAKNSAFTSLTDAEFVTGIKDGSIVAGVNGTWNAVAAQEAWGDNYAAVKLPTYNVNGSEVQMSSFAGFKLIGVNAFSKQPAYAMLLADWLTNYDNQMLRFEKAGEGPSNVKAAASDEVLKAPAIAALAEQSSYATAQRVGGNFWDPAATFGKIMIQGNPDGTDLQTLLDNMVAGITAPVQ